jgi:hypothetical protein
MPPAARRDIVAEHSIATGVARTRAAARLTRSAARA